MGVEMRLGELSGDFLGTRFEGRALRLELERGLSLPDSTPMRLNFSGVTITQSCADEFLGVLVAIQGKALIDRLVFQNCSPDVRAVLELVIGSRLENHAQLERTERIRQYMLEKRVTAG
jgi:hypothetical protein